MIYEHRRREAARVNQKIKVLKGRPSPRVFIVYEHRLFQDVLANILGRGNVIGALERAATPLATIVKTINGTRADIVIIESEADGNSAWHILLAGGGARQVIVLDVDRELIREYTVRTSPIDTLEDLWVVIGEE